MPSYGSGSLFFSAPVFTIHVFILFDIHSTFILGTFLTFHPYIILFLFSSDSFPSNYHYWFLISSFPLCCVVPFLFAIFCISFNSQFFSCSVSFCSLLLFHSQKCIHSADMSLFTSCSKPFSSIFDSFSIFSPLRFLFYLQLLAVNYFLLLVILAYFAFSLFVIHVNLLIFYFGPFPQLFFINFILFYCKS